MYLSYILLPMIIIHKKIHFHIEKKKKYQTFKGKFCIVTIQRNIYRDTSPLDFQVFFLSRGPIIHAFHNFSNKKENSQSLSNQIFHKTRIFDN